MILSQRLAFVARYDYRRPCDAFIALVRAMDYRQQLLSLAEGYSVGKGISEARVANLARCDSRFFVRLRSGGSCRVDTLHRVFQFFSDNWPDDAVAWPASIQRPAKQEKAA